MKYLLSLQGQDFAANGLVLTTVKAYSSISRRFSLIQCHKGISGQECSTFKTTACLGILM